MLDILVLAFATWRLSSWMTDPLDGGFALFDKLRYLAGIRYDKHSNPYCSKREWFCKWFLCQWCMSFAVGVLFTFLQIVFGEIVTVILLPLALSTCAIMIDSYILRMTRRRH